MVDEVRLVGRLVSGQGVARTFTRAEWARSAFMTAVGIDPYPGTLNLSVADGPERATWLAARGGRGILMPAPTAAFCDGRLFRARVGAPSGKPPIDGAVVVPMVAKYPDDQLEIIASIGLRDALVVADGDELIVAIDLTGSRPVS